MAIQIVITDAGRAEIVNAQNNGTAPVLITQIGFGSGQYTPTVTQTALQTEIKRLNTISGTVVADDTIHVTGQDESADAYEVYEFGLFTESGTLFAVYSQNTAIIDKTTQSFAVLAVDLVFTTIDATSLTFGNLEFINPPASTTQKGVIEIATTAEALAGTSTTLASTPATTKEQVDQHGDLTNNPHNVTKVQVGLGDVDNVSAASLRSRSTHTGTQTLSTISNAGTAAARNAGTPNGVAELDSNGKVPLTQINDSILGQVEYKGLWNPATNTPTLGTTPAEKGIYYICSAAGSRFGLTFETGDWIISNGATWDKVDNTDAVNSVNGRTGNVTITAADVNAYTKTESDSRYFTQSVSDDRYLNEANNLSDLPNVTTARSNLGLGTAATRNVGESAGNVMEIGFSGLGTNGSIIPNDNIGNIDLNQFGTTGFYFCGPSSTLTNAPPDAVGSSDYGYLTVISGNANGRMYQEFTWSRYAQNSNRKFIRTYVNDENAWTPWQEVYTSGNLPNPVQTGESPSFENLSLTGNIQGGSQSSLSFTNNAGVMPISIKDLLISDSLADRSNVPTVGAWIKGEVNCASLNTRTTSDNRLKHKIKAINVDYNKLDKLFLLEGFYNALAGDKEGEHFIGSIAQDVQAVFPHCVGEVEHKTLGKTLTVDYPKLALAVALAELQRPLKYKIKRLFRQLIGG